MRLAARAAVAAALCAMVPAVHAAEWRFTPTLSAQETYTDNVFLAPDTPAPATATTATTARQKTSDFITQVTPGVALVGRGGRATVSGSYNANKTFFRENSERDSLHHSFTAAGNAEIWEKQAFIDARANMTRQTVNPQAATSDSPAGQQVNRVDVLNTDITPYFLHHFGTWVETRSEVGYRTFSTYRPSTDTGNAGAGATANTNISDTQTYHSSFTANTGRRFTQTKVSATNVRDKVMREGGAPSNKTDRTNVNVTQIISPEWSLIGSAGKEKIDDGTLRQNRDEYTWNAGAAWQPSRRTDARATYGHTLVGESYDFSASHRFSERTALNISYHETIQIEQNQQATNLSFIGTDANGNLIDTRTGQPFVQNSDSFGLQNNAFIQKRFAATLSGTRGRTSFGLTAARETRETEATGVTTTSLEGSANLSRRLSSRSSVNAGITYRQQDFGAVSDRIDTQLNFNTGWSYTIGPHLSSNLSYKRTRRESTIETNNMTENAITLSLIQTF